MSTKTLRKRIALATVAALGAGVLSLVSVPAANATANNAPGTGGPTAATAVLNIGTAAVTNGNAVTSVTSNANASTGLLSVSNLTASTRNADNTQAATLLSNGVLVVYTTINANNGSLTANTVGAISVTGGTIVPGTPSTSSTASTSPVPAAETNMAISYNSSLTTVGFDGHSINGAAVPAMAFAIKPNSGATSMTVSLYTGTYAATTGDAAAYASAPTTGTLNGNIAVTIASTSSAGALSAANSGIYYATNSANTNTITADDTTPASGQYAIGTNAWNVNQFATAYIRDAYGNAITTGALVQASATNGAYVSIVAGQNSTAPTASTSFVTSTSSLRYGIQVNPNSTGKAGSTTVTVTVNGTVLGTKSFSWFGKVAKVTISGAGNGKISTSAGTTLTTPGQFATLVLKDDAGNTVYPGAHAVGTGSFPANTAITKNAASSNVTLGSTNYLAGDLGAAFATTGGVVSYNCTLASNTSGQLVVDYTNLDGTIVTSNALPVTCSGSPYTYTAAFDKQSYAPGDVATLTVTFKDSTGALAADLWTQNAAGTVLTSAISNTLPTITASQLTATGGTSSTNAAKQYDVTTNGVIKYVFTVGTTTGSYQAIVNYPDVNGASGQSAVTVPYKIADGATSLNDVLKGIVSLIASINKQIAALAKLVTKKK